MSDRPMAAAPLYVALAVFSLVGASAALRVSSQTGAMRADVRSLAQWIQHHPSDWLAYKELTLRALDSDVPDRAALWRQSFAAAAALTPWRDDPRMAYVRDGLFHWMDLSPRERRDLLANTAPLLRTGAIFDSVAPPLYQLTGDLDFLVKNAPPRLSATSLLATIAASAGDYDRYRRLRDALPRQRLALFQAEKNAKSSEELLTYLPAVVRVEDEPLVRAILGELQQRPLEAERADARLVDEIADYALRHGVEPLGGIEAVVPIHGAASDPIRARLALHFGSLSLAASIEASSTAVDQTQWTSYYLDRAEFERSHGRAAVGTFYDHKAADSRRTEQTWRGTCGSNEVCTTADAEILTWGPASATMHIAPADAGVPPYTEVYFDDARIDEGVISAEHTLALATRSRGVHPIEVVIAAPFAPDGRERRLRVSAPAL